MKRILMISLLAVLCIVLGVTATMALITNEQTGVNVVTMGNLKIATIQTAIEENTKTPKPFEGDFKLVPGKEHSWILEVENKGSQDAYVRVGIEKIIKLAEGTQGIPDTSVMKLNLNDTDWQLKDGYYYYKKPLGAGKKTEPLFESLVFDVNAGNLYQGATATANISVCATQVKNNGASVLEAKGWTEGK